MLSVEDVPTAPPKTQQPLPVFIGLSPAQVKPSAVMAPPVPSFAVPTLTTARSLLRTRARVCPYSPVVLQASLSEPQTRCRGWQMLLMMVKRCMTSLTHWISCHQCVCGRLQLFATVKKDGCYSR